MSSLEPVSAAPTPLGGGSMQHVILFEHANFRGAHKHVFTAEPNLNAPDDNFFNDKVSSLVILNGAWNFFSRANFEGLYREQSLGGGTFPFVGDVGIVNDDMSSLSPA